MNRNALSIPVALLVTALGLLLGCQPAPDGSSSGPVSSGEPAPAATSESAPASMDVSVEPERAPLGMGMTSPPFAVPVSARHLRRRPPEIRVERQKELGSDRFTVKAQGKAAVLILNGVDVFDLTREHIEQLNAGQAIHVEIDEAFAGETVSVEAYVPMVNARNEPTAPARFEASIQIPADPGTRPDSGTPITPKVGTPKVRPGLAPGGGKG